MNENKMETMPVNKLLITMAAPMVLSMLIGALYNVVDSLFVSHYGENALSAVFFSFSDTEILLLQQEPESVAELMHCYPVF